VGLTGSAGCGKSAALECFGKLGWHCLDADGICRGLYEGKNQEIVSALTARWGAEAFLENGDIDKKFVAGRVFGNRDELDWLEKLVHPMVMRIALKEAESSQNPHVMFDVPLLHETGLENMFDHVICVWCDRKTQQERLAKRGWSRAEIDSRLGNQMEPDKKLELADFGLINTGSLDSLMEQCRRLDARLRTEQPRT